MGYTLADINFYSHCGMMVERMFPEMEVATRCPRLVDVARAGDCASGDAAGAAMPDHTEPGLRTWSGAGLMIADMLMDAALARNVVEQVRAGMAALPRAPGLAVVLVGDDPASQVYVRNKIKACARGRHRAELRAQLPADTTRGRAARA